MNGWFSSILFCFSSDFLRIFFGKKRDDNNCKFCYNFLLLQRRTDVLKRGKKGRKIEKMLTKNFWSIFGVVMPRYEANSNYAPVVYADGTAGSEALLSSSSRPHTVLGAMVLPRSNTNYGSSIGTWYGRGTTPATVDDYALEAPITDSSLTGTCGGISALLRVAGADHYRISVTHQVTNTTAEEITISEVGCFGQLSAGGKVVLLDHTVLETPVVIPPKETVSLEYVIKFPYGN